MRISLTGISPTSGQRLGDCVYFDGEEIKVTLGCFTGSEREAVKKIREKYKGLAKVYSATGRHRAAYAVRRAGKTYERALKAVCRAAEANHEHHNTFK